ncbi:MAG: HEAT repeat domain-containing protein [Ktedonobacteraceae bacterium]
MSESFDNEMSWYRTEILRLLADSHYVFQDKEGASAFIKHMQQLAQEDRVRFQSLILNLLEDSQENVRREVIKLLLSMGNIPDTQIAIALIKLIQQEPALRESALYALGQVKTQRVLPVIISFARKGYAPALGMVLKMALSPEQQEKLSVIARNFLGESEYRLREAALFFLNKYSSMEKEAEYLLPVVDRYCDELFIDALKDAPPELVLGRLKEIRAKYEKTYADFGRYAQYKDLSRTIDVLEQKAAERKG